MTWLLVELDAALGGLELRPGLRHAHAGLVAGDAEIELPLALGLLGLADRGVFGAALIDRTDILRLDRRVERLQRVQRLLVVLLHAALQRQRRIERALGDLDLMRRDVDVVLRGRDGGVLRDAGGHRGGQRVRR